MASNASLDGLRGLRKFELQSMLSKLKLPVHGTKAELIQRIALYNTKCEIDDQFKTAKIEISKIELEMTRLHSIIKPTKNMTSTPQHGAQPNKTPGDIFIRKIEQPSVRFLPQSTTDSDLIRESEKSMTNIPMELTLGDHGRINKPTPVPRQSVYMPITSSDNSHKSSSPNVAPKPAPRKSLTKFSSQLGHDLSNNRNVPDNDQNSQAISCYSSTCNNNSGTEATNIQLSDIIKAFTQSLAMSKLPTPEPPVFTGETLKYKDWKKAFNAMIVYRGLSDRKNLFYLQRYVSGEAAEAISGYFTLDSRSAYSDAQAVLDRRYGNSFVISEAFRTRLENWPKISARDGAALRRFSDFLGQCNAAMFEIPELKLLDDNRENRKMLCLLPDWLVNLWNRNASKYQIAHNCFPPFSEFENFIRLEADIACNPVTSLQSLRPTPQPRSHNTDQRRHHALASAVTHRDNSLSDAEPCAMCNSISHKLAQCPKFEQLPIDDKYSLVTSKRLSFVCLAQNHFANQCRVNKLCDQCGGRHATILYRSKTKTQEIVNNNQHANNAHCNSAASSMQNTGLCTMIIPVWVSTRSNPSKKHLTYALLDTQSDVTFITNEVARQLKSNSITPTTLKILTMTSQGSNVKCDKLTDIIIRGYTSKESIDISTCYTRDSIPHNIDHIPTNKLAQRIPHLHRIADQIPPLLDCGVGLLIGYNCSRALSPVEFIPAKGNLPYAVKTALGWCLVGSFTPSTQKQPKSIHSTLSHRISSEELTSSELLKKLEGDFSVPVKDDFVSQEDMAFLSIMNKEVVQLNNGYYYLPLPLKQGGPDLNNDLLGVLTRFRLEHVAVACDIEKMFHHFKVLPKYRDYLRFLWFSPTDPTKIVVYRMCVHLFGARSSPAVAKFALKQLASDYAKKDSSAGSFIHRNFYVDDGLISVPTISEAINLVKATQSICMKGNVRVHKLLSNERQVMQAFPKEDWAGEPNSSYSLLPAIERTLGIQWCLDTDTFQFDFKIDCCSCTRQNVLSGIATIFDPIGVLSPLLLEGRYILQMACKEKLGWDQKLPKTLEDNWKKWRGQFNSVSRISIPRCLKPASLSGSVILSQIHTFADASSIGYGACSYLRQKDRFGNVCCSFLMGKSRVAPLKVTTIPRLELQAGVLAAKQHAYLQAELDVLHCEGFLWTDSKINWVESQSNPADFASRGLEASSFLRSFWLSGPEFLLQKDFSAKNPAEFLVHDDDPEVKLKNPAYLHVINSDTQSAILDTVEKLSRWTSAVRCAALVYGTIKSRFKYHVHLSVELLERTKIWLISSVQRATMQKDYEKLTRDKMVEQSGSMWRLDPFIDENGVIRVGGRMKFSSMLYREKHPIVLPREGHITKLITEHYHRKAAHQGRTTTMAAIRSAEYWIVSSRSVVSAVIHNCVACRRLRRNTEVQKMADLPSDRTDPSSPFMQVGLDCFGPFLVKEGRKSLKKYGVIFVCLQSRAVHVELVDDMSTYAFINSLRCFIALRGNVYHIRCDRGSNFVGAANELAKAFKEMSQDHIKSFLLDRNCDFVFNSPSASHMGRVWERLIRVFRNIINGILLQSHDKLDSASIRTLFYETMSIVNSRPISKIEDDVEPLTPNHLLMIKPEMVQPPPGVFTSADMYARKRWRRVQHLVNLSWSRWKSEYLQALQNRSKWQGTKRNLKVGDIVLLKDEPVC
ncbi:uncharacterized protein [Watersipora subatra]|uniref:uncharacterized protein n=1 Tax=Watersipora subatra TaxID=2589382 RepID=UPI00355C0F47